MGLVVEQSAIDESHRCTVLIHAGLYEYEDSGKRELELQVGMHRRRTSYATDSRLWFMMLRDDPWPTPYSFAGDDPGFTEQADEETTCRSTLDPSLYEDLGTIERVGFECYPRWGIRSPGPRHGDPDECDRALTRGPVPVRVYGDD